MAFLNHVYESQFIKWTPTSNKDSIARSRDRALATTARDIGFMWNVWENICIVFVKLADGLNMF